MIGPGGSSLVYALVEDFVLRGSLVSLFSLLFDVSNSSHI